MPKGAEKTGLLKAFLCAVAFLFCSSFMAGAQETPQEAGGPLGPEESRSAVERLKEAQASIETLSAHVRQRKKSPLLAKEIESSGSVYLKRPNLLRWEIKSPEAMTVVVDGQWVWVYRPKEKEATRRALSNDVAARYTAEFFSSALKLSLDDIGKRFLAEVYRKDGTTKLRLKPRSSVAAKFVKNIEISYRESDGVPERFEVEGRNGNVTLTELDEARINAEIGKDTFSLRLPKDVRVINIEENDAR